MKEGITGVLKPRFKACLVAKGYTQKEGIDYNEIFSLVVKMTSIRMLLSLVVQDDLEMDQLDVKTAFLHGFLTETIYMKQPLGYVKMGQENLFCLLKKSIYGLKQSPRCCYQRFDDFVSKIGFTKSSFDNCVYINTRAFHQSVFLLLYVDDMLLVGKTKETLNKVKSLLKKEFNMKDLGESKRILGVEINRTRGNSLLQIIQSNYCDKILMKFKVNEAKTVSTPLAHHLNFRPLTHLMKMMRNLKL